ncbi:MAG TPA: protein kinase, partial [Candidatus Limnocylindrales bacterium]|nr:protein kinase [Candidatus Limnocylindrales bacterium]
MADIGTVLGGRYRLIELLGQGGMATIYRARDSQLERDVAVKVLRPEYGTDPDFGARFRQEAQSAVSLNHPGIVAVFDYGTDLAGPFIVMELVDGEDLATILRRSGALPPRQAARLVAQAARAIAAAHQHGFVHRDVKPGNILVTRDGRVKVTDFGIARALAESALTLPGTTLGSVHYFSPEQARGEPATEASDIYSLGIVLFELLTGRRPWEGDTAAAIATARLTGPVPNPSAVRAGIPPTIEAIDRKALAPQPEDRFASAAAMADALERYLAEDRAAAPAAVAGGAAAGAGAAGAGGAAAAGIAGAAGAAAGLGAAGVAGAGAPTVAAGNAAAGAGAAGVAGAGTARANPSQIPYREDDYAGAPPPPRPPRGGSRTVEAEDEGGGGGSAWLWLSALLAIGVLALAGFLVFKLLNSPTGPPPASAQVTVPNFVGMTYDQAQTTAADYGLQVSRAAFATADAAVDTVLSQNPPAGTAVGQGSTVALTLAAGTDTVVVPDLKGRTESDALNLIFSSGLGIGSRTEAYDPTVPVGSIISQDPGAGLVVTKGLLVDYVVSKGPEPTPTP